MTKLLIDFCSYEAAKWAVLHWHYSKSMPAGKMVKVGVWEDGTFIGCIIFSRGGNKHIGHPYGLLQTEVVELTRIALREHKIKVSEIVSKGIKLFNQFNPGLRLLISYADSAQGHIGVIYQAGNWVYVGEKYSRLYKIYGELIHPKTVYGRYGQQGLEFLKEKIDPSAEEISCSAKHKYLYPLDKAMRRQITILAKPYPKRADVDKMESRQATSLEAQVQFLPSA